MQWLTQSLNWLDKLSETDEQMASHLPTFPGIPHTCVTWFNVAHWVWEGCWSEDLGISPDVHEGRTTSFVPERPKSFFFYGWLYPVIFIYLFFPLFLLVGG